MITGFMLYFRVLHAVMQVMCIGDKHDFPMLTFFGLRSLTHKCHYIATKLFDNWQNHFLRKNPNLQQFKSMKMDWPSDLLQTAFFTVRYVSTRNV